MRISDWSTDVCSSDLGRLSLPGYRARLKEVYENFITPEQNAAFFELLRAAKRPLIYAGGGVIHGDASVQLRSFPKTFGLPVTTTLMGLGCYDTTEPLALELLVMPCTPLPHHALDDCDFLTPDRPLFHPTVPGPPP